MLTIDLNADGINDFTIHGGFHTTFAVNAGGPFPSGGYVSVRPSQAVNQVVFATSAQGSKFLQALAQGAVIGSSAVRRLPLDGVFFGHRRCHFWETRALVPRDQSLPGIEVCR